MLPLANIGRIGALVLVAGATTFSVLSSLPAQDQPPSLTYGTLAIRGFELREARHSPPIRMTGPDGVVGHHGFSWQIVVRGDAFPIRALDPILWVGDVKLLHYERQALADGGQELVYEVVDPKLLRAEHPLQVIYGGDERTRTKLLERLDPEKLVKLPDAERAAAGIPDLEGLKLVAVGADGQVAGRGRLSDGVVRLVARGESGKLVLLPAKIVLAGDGSFSVDAGPLPAGTTHVAALLVTGDQKGEFAVGGAELGALPKGVELLDSKPLGTKPR